MDIPPVDHLTPAALHELHEMLDRRLAEISLREHQAVYLLVGDELLAGRVELTIEPGDGLPLRGPHADVHVGPRTTIRVDPDDAIDGYYVSHADGGTRLAVQVGSGVGYALRPDHGRTFSRVPAS